MNLVQLLDAGGIRRVGLLTADGACLALLSPWHSTREPVLAACRQRRPLADLARASVTERTESFDEALAELRVLPPLRLPGYCIIRSSSIPPLTPMLPLNRLD